MPGSFIELTASDGFAFKAYKVFPEGTPKGAIVVIQEIFGVNANIREMTDRIAGLGYVAIAPAVFDRYQRDVDLGYTEADRAIAFGFVPKLDIPAMLLDVAACKADVDQYGKVGITGFCLGGTIAWLGATRLGFDAAVGFYGGMIGRFADEKVKCPVILHFGGLDAHIPASVGEAAKAANPEIEVYTYPQADHAFMRVGNAAYEPASAELAWSRTVPFFAEHIG